MALVVEIVQVADKVYAVTTRQIAEEEGDSDWDALQRIADASAEDALERMEVRELLQTLLERTPLHNAKGKFSLLFWKAKTDFAEIARKVGLDALASLGFLSVGGQKTAPKRQRVGHRALTFVGLSFQIVEREFRDLDEVLIWVDRNQLGRRNLTDEQRTIVIGRLYKTAQKKPS
jgi:hypothetical protein